MVFWCTNNYCGYGKAWDRGDPVPRNKDNTVDKFDRAESYSQNPSFENPDISGFDGKCLNCIADAEREERFCYETY